MLPAGGGTPRSLQPRRALACHHLDPCLGCTHSRCNTPKLYTQARLSALLATGAGKRVAAPVTMTHTMSVSIGRGGAAEQPAVPLAPLAADAATAAGGPEELQSRIVHGLYDALLAADVPFDQLASPPPPPPPPPPLSISGPSLARRARPQTWSETADAGRAHTTQPPEHRGSWGDKQRPTTLHGGRAADEMLAGLSKRQQHRHLQYQEVRCTSRRPAGGGAVSVAPTLDLALSRWSCSSSSSCTSGSSRSSGSSSARRSSCSSSTASGGGGGRARRRS